MDSWTRADRYFRREPVDRLPVQPICMTFAARLAGIPYGEYVKDYRKLVEAQLLVHERFGFDVVTLCSDPCREAADCGAQLRWFEDQPPSFEPTNHLLGDKRRLAGLKRPDPVGGGRMHDRVLGVSLFAEKVGGKVPVLGWIEGPMAEGADLRGINALMLDFFDDPGFVRDLFDFVIEMEIDFARAQVEAGADVIGIGDAAASLVDRETYRQFILAGERREVEAIQAMGARARVHICGEVDHLLEDMATLGADMYDIDSPSDLALARATLGPEPLILGNIDPVRVVLQGPPAEIHRALSECHARVGERYVVGAGCEVPPATPPAHAQAMMDYARGYGAAGKEA